MGTRLAITALAGALCSVFSAPIQTDASGSDGGAYDVVVYGGTSAGVIAAVQTARMGKSVVLIEPGRHLGGLTSGGLGWTDTGNKAVIGGLAREFYQRLKRHYDNPTAWKYQKPEECQQYRPKDDAQWTFEPSVAEEILEVMLREQKVPVIRGERLNRATGMRIAGRKILSIVMESGKTFSGRVFLDATYEGDLMASAGVSYHVGREANAVYGETWNGVQKDARHHGHYFKSPVDPYVKPGDSSSGLLPRISSDPPGENGQGDHRIQAYCFRMCLTRVPENRVSFPKPDGYDPAQYELLLRVLDTGWREVFRKFDPMPNAKTDTNNHGPFSTDNIGMNYDYPDGSYARRDEIIREHQTYQKGLMYFLANDPRVPKDVRSVMSEWGLAKDEFVDNGHWPHQIYVREARRMIGGYVMTDQDCLAMRDTPRPVGMGSYAMDSHNVQRYVTDEGTVQNEGDIGVSPRGPYKIAYDALVPKKDECVNLLVPVCVSSSHIAYGSIRMEPVFMILGQSAATAACLVIDGNSAVQEVDYASLRERLVADKQVLEWSKKPKRPQLDPASLPGTVLDDVDAELTGNWLRSASISGYIGKGYLHDSNENKGKMLAVFRYKVPTTGDYSVRIAYPANANRATNVPVTVSSAESERVVTVNQKEASQDGSFMDLGTFRFQAGDVACVTISNTKTNGHVVVDAVQFLPVGK